MKKFITIWIGQLVSMIGSGIVSFALAVWLYNQTGKATPFGIVVFLGTIPRVIFSPLAGVLADRYSRKLIMILSDSLSALASLALLMIILFSELKIYQIYLIAVIDSIGQSFQGPAYSASIPMLVKGESLGRANGLNEALSAMLNLMPPLIGGLLFGLIGLRGILAIDFITFFAALGTLTFVAIPMPRRNDEDSGKKDKEGMGRRLTFGFRFLKKHPGLTGLMLQVSLISFLMSFTVVTLVPYVLSFSNSATLGIVQSISGAGMLAGSLLIGITGTHKKKIPLLFLATIISGLGLILMGVRAEWYFVTIGFFITMFIGPIASSHAVEIWQKKVPLEFQGRVASARMAIGWMLPPFAFLSAGVLADKVFIPMFNTPTRGLGLMFIISGILLTVSSVFFFLYSPLKNVETEIPDALNIV